MKLLLSKTLPPIFFYGVMLIYLALSFYFIFRAYQPAYPDYALTSVLKIQPSEINTDSVAVDCDCERKFQKSYPVIWSEKVIATFAGGEDIGVKTYDQNAKYKQFYVDGNGLYNYDMGEDVRIQGNLVGLTCAYSNTVSGECVGEVEAEKITQL